MEVKKNIEVSSSKLKVNVKEFVPKSAQQSSNVFNNSCSHLEDHNPDVYVHSDPGPYNVQQSFGSQSAAPYHYPTNHNTISPLATWPQGGKEELYSLFPTEAKKKNRGKKMSGKSGESVNKEIDLPCEVTKPITSNIWSPEPKVQIWSRKDKLPTSEINVASMDWPDLEPQQETQDTRLQDSKSKQESIKKTFAELLKQPTERSADDNQSQKSFNQQAAKSVKVGKLLNEQSPKGKLSQGKKLTDSSQRPSPASTMQVKKSYKPIGEKFLKQPSRRTPDDNQSQKSDAGQHTKSTKVNKQFISTDKSQQAEKWTGNSQHTKSDSIMKVQKSHKGIGNKKQSFDSARQKDDVCFDTKHTEKTSINKEQEKCVSSLSRTVEYKGTTDRKMAYPPRVTENLPNSPMSWSSIVRKKSSHQETSVIKQLTQKDESEEAKLSNATLSNTSDSTNPKVEQNEGKLPNTDKQKITDEEARELLRIKRRERRKREKETKKKVKEEEQRKKIYEPKTSKIQMISNDILQKVYDSPTKGTDSEKRKGIKFMDEEYPDLLTIKKKMDKPSISTKSKILSREARDGEGRLISDAESNSEWETEDESKHSGYDTGMESSLQSDVEDACPKGLQLDEDVASTEVKYETPLSYSSILKSKSVPKNLKKKPSPVERKDVKTNVADKLEKKKDLVEKKKVKKKDPIAFDLFSALNANIQKQKQPSKKASQSRSKSSAVLGGKLQKEALGTSVRNQLDSTAPVRRRGKEREGGKKKRPTLMKKIILVDREKRKMARKEAEVRRTERIQAGIVLKPLTSPDLLQNAKNDEVTDIIVKKESDNHNAKEKLVDGEEIISKTSSDVGNEDMARNNDPKNNELEAKAKLTLHSRKFRDYCTNDLSPELDKVVSNLMIDLVRFQDKQHEKDPVKAKSRRRYVVGLREVKKFMKVKKVSCLIIAPDMEKVATEGGLDDCVSNLQAIAKENSITVIFALNRRKLGRICKKKVPISCIGVMNQQGSDENYNLMLELATNLRNSYAEKLAATMNSLSDMDNNAPDYQQQFNFNNNGLSHLYSDFMHQTQDSQTFALSQYENSYTSFIPTDMEMTLAFTSNQVGSVNSDYQQMSSLSISDAQRKMLDMMRN